MRKIIASTFISLDGVMQAPGGPTEDQSGGFDLGGWTWKYADEKSGAAVMKMIGTPDDPYDLLLGRKTYDIFSGHWPHVPEDNPIGSIFNKVNKYVMTNGSGNFTWANSHKISSIAELKSIKSGDGATIVLWGSSTIFPLLLEANLIDKLQLLTFPLVLGKGKKLFGSSSHSIAMKLVSHEVNSNGIVITNYELSQ